MNVKKAENGEGANIARRERASDIRNPSRHNIVWCGCLLILCFLLASCDTTGPLSPVLESKIAPGVYLDEHLVGDKKISELQTLLEDIALLGKIESKEASPDSMLRPGVQGVLPGRDGLQLDIEATLTALRDAQPNERVRTCWLAIPPKISWRSFSDRVPYRGSPERREVALAINVAWGDEMIPGILDLLEREGIKATWFLTGRWADYSPEMAAAIGLRGHELGNHGYSDPHMTEISDEEILEEIQRTQIAVYEATGVDPLLFSPPYLELDQRILNLASSLGLRTVMYQVDTADWLLPGPERIAERVLLGLVPGAIILCHPTEQTAAGLELIIAGARQEGYRFVTVGQLLDESR